MKKLIGASIVLIFVGVAGYFYFLRTVPSLGSASMPTPTASTTDTGVSYTADGKLDTSNWQEYRSEYGGFSVRAPRGTSRFFSCTHACDSYWGERFEYLLAKGPDNYVGPSGLSVEIIRKNSTSTLDTWIHDYIGYGKNYLSNIQRTNLGKHPSLQFDFDEHQPGAKADLKMATMQYDSYPWGYTSIYELSNPPYAISRYVISDLGDRYAFIRYTVSVDKKAEVSYFTTNSYYYWVSESQLLDSKTLSDIYTAILDSFQAFTPTKS